MKKIKIKKQMIEPHCINYKELFFNYAITLKMNANVLGNC